MKLSYSIQIDIDIEIHIGYVIDQILSIYYLSCLQYDSLETCISYSQQQRYRDGQSAKIRLRTDCLNVKVVCIYF